MTIRTFDLVPLFRSTVGFDRLAYIFDFIVLFDSGVSCFPYNIERTDENYYRISLAVAGGAEMDLAIEVKEGVLLVQGRREAETEGAPSATTCIRALPDAISNGASSWRRMSKCAAQAQCVFPHPPLRPRRTAAPFMHFADTIQGKSGRTFGAKNNAIPVTPFHRCQDGEDSDQAQVTSVNEGGGVHQDTALSVLAFLG